MADSKGSIFPDDRVWYDQFTSTDWVHDSIADAYRAKALRSRKDFWARVYLLFDGAQGWILSALVGFVVAVLAYVVNVSEATVFDFKDGYCARGWHISEKVSERRAALIHISGRGETETKVLLERRNAARMALAPTGGIGARSCRGSRLVRGGPSTSSTLWPSSPSPACLVSSLSPPRRLCPRPTG